MKTAVILTIGTRDVQVNVQNLKKLATPEEFEKLIFRNSGGAEILQARPTGRFILQKNLLGEVSIPIAKTAIDYVLLNQKEIDKIIFIVTNQDIEDVGERFFNTDTINYGKIIQTLIHQRFAKERIKIPEFSTIEIKENVAILDAMYELWKRKVTSNPILSIKEASKIYLCNQAGLDAINTALMLNCIDLFGDKIKILSVNERTGLCSELHFSNQYSYMQEKEKVFSLLSSYHYPAIADMKVNDTAKKIAEYAKQRIYFNFDECIKVLNTITSVEISPKIKEQYLLHAYDCKNRKDDSLIKELYINAKIKFEQASYVDFLLRFFRIVEEIAKQKALEFLKITNYDPYKWTSTINEILLNNSKLKDFIEIYEIVLPNGKKTPLDITKNSIPVFIAIIEFFEGKSELFNFLSAVTALTQLRNKSIGAHDFNPVSLEIIESEIQNFSISINDVFTYMDKYFSITENPFLKINELIVSKL